MSARFRLTLTETLAICFMFVWFPSTSSLGDSHDFGCGGSLEKEIWRSWDQEIRKNFFLEGLLQGRLQRKGDTYALYDFQAYSHNLVAMARRCGRVERLREVASLIRVAYAALEASPFPWSGRRWVCRGGRVCTRKNRLLNSEVMLHSVQFLGVATAVANALATAGPGLNREDEAFLRETVGVAVEHLQRWGDESAVLAIKKRMEASPLDVQEGSSALFFSDKLLWQMGVYADLAGILAAIGEKRLSSVGTTTEQFFRLERYYGMLVRLFSARVSLRVAADSGISGGLLADIDRGFWRSYVDGRYAGYTEKDKPVVCVVGGDGNVRPKAMVAPDDVPQLPDTGWDISHARRLVHVLDALKRNRVAITVTWGAEPEIAPTRLSKAFAGNLLHEVWNGDLDYPLFTNYWSGANGWYRVAWDDGTGKCREGTPPFGLTSSFATGGYVTWASYQPVIGELGLRLYSIFQSSRAEDVAFTERHYPNFAHSATPEKVALARLMFLPSLVGIEQ